MVVKTEQHVFSLERNSEGILAHRLERIASRLLHACVCVRAHYFVDIYYLFSLIMSCSIAAFCDAKSRVHTQFCGNLLSFQFNNVTFNGCFL